METTVREEEALKFLYLIEEGLLEEEVIPISKYHLTDQDFQNLEKKGYAKKVLEKEDKLSWRLTEKGKKEAEEIVRRMRLAEWLFLEVIEAKEGDMEEAACQFEHLLTEESTDKICTFFGHPRYCPHGRFIPLGKCCIEKRMVITPLFLPLDHLKSGEKGKVVSIFSENGRELNILVSLGIVPGTFLEVVSNHPSLLVKIDEALIALDKKVASKVYVKLVKD